MASYRLMHGPTERYITPHSLLWTSGRDSFASTVDTGTGTASATATTTFLTGSDSLVCLFDASRDGQGPVAAFPTIPSKRKKLVGGGVGIKGIVSALAVSRDGVLAAGTFTCQLGLYDGEGSGECIAVFALPPPLLPSPSSQNDGGGGGGVGGNGVGAADDGGGEEGERRGGRVGGGGGGITQILWSPCGRYMYVAERRTHRILSYDVRVTGKQLGSLLARPARTNQRLGVDVGGPVRSVGSSCLEYNDSRRHRRQRYRDGHDLCASEERHQQQQQQQQQCDHSIWAGGTDGVVRVWAAGAATMQGDVYPSWEWQAHDDG